MDKDELYTYLEEVADTLSDAGCDFYISASTNEGITFIVENASFPQLVQIESCVRRMIDSAVDESTAGWERRRRTTRPRK